MAIFKPFIKIFLLLPLLIVVAITACNNKKPIVNHPIHSVEDVPIYRQAWNYGQLTDTIRNAKVIAYIKNAMFCGRATCASVSIVKVGKGDTIRVLELCSTHRDFEQGAKVDIKPGKKPLSSVSLPPLIAYDRKNYKTYYGTVITAN